MNQPIDSISNPSLPSTQTTLTPEEIKQVKGLGFLLRKGTNTFNARVITRNGKITTEEMIAVAQAAKEFGNGEIAMTSRMTLEVQGIPFEKIDAFCARLAENGLSTGGTGNKVRPVVSCKGTTCHFGLIDTYALSEKIHELFYVGYHAVTLPHKFKIAVGGCPNNCVKPDLNDLGIIGQYRPVLNASLCRSCKVCSVAKACPVHASRLEDGKLVFGEGCNRCGRCIGKCPFNAVCEGNRGCKITIGGRWGKRVAQGKALNHLFTSEQEVLETVEKTILLFRKYGKAGERFADVIDRLGFEAVEKELLSSSLLEEKESILSSEITQ